jgi:acyl carrier protein
MSAILERMQPVFREVFDEPGLVLSGDMTADDIENWDSFTVVDLIVAVEREFGVKFTTAEVTGLNSVGTLASLVERKIADRV